MPSRANVLHPVSLVSGPQDLAAGQQRLANFLQPLNAHDSTYAGEPEISAGSARQVTASRLYLCRVLAQMSRRLPQTQAFSSFFETRAEVLAALQPQLRYLIDLEPSEPNMRRFWQQSELIAAMTRMDDRGVDLRLEPLQMLALANATHDATHNPATCVRRELLRANTNRRDANPRHEDGPVRVGRRSQLEAALTDLVHMPAPNIPVATYSSPLQRAALRQTLGITPTFARPPAPYPAARGLADSDRSR